MLTPASENDLYSAMLATLAGADVNTEPARIAFETTRGDFAARFAAAIQAQLALLAKPEVVIDVPEHPEMLTRAELAELIEPAVAGFLRSQPSKAELLAETERIRRRQERRPGWIPTVDRDGRPIPQPVGAEDELPLTCSTAESFPELGEVPIQLPTDGDDRPEVPMLRGGIGELEVVLHTVLGTAGAEGVLGDVWLDTAANEALVPDDACWWPRDRGEPVPAAQDPGVAAELLATSPTLGGVPVTEDSLPAVVQAIAAAGDWRLSRRWRLAAWEPSEDAEILVTARAALAGWAHETGSGLILHVSGGAFHAHDGLSGYPWPLHSFLLCVARSGDGTDRIDSVHRLTLSCPGTVWCHRGGCDEQAVPELGWLLAPLAEAGQTASAVADQGKLADAYQRLYGAAGFTEDADAVLDVVNSVLDGAGWTELERSTWEGGLEEALFRRAEHCLMAQYDPVTRRLRLADGKAGLELSVDVLAQEGVITGDEVDVSEAVIEQWGADRLAAARDLLRGAMDELPHHVESTVLGLHPLADGGLHGPESFTLATKQVSALLRAMGNSILRIEVGGGARAGG